MSHRPGPWVVHYDASCECFEITTEDGVSIVTVYGDDPQDVADARLISLAPEMLALLVEVRNEGAIDKVCNKVNDKVNALIARAQEEDR
jgi:hypothetical protein